MGARGLNTVYKTLRSIFQKYADKNRRPVCSVASFVS